MFDSPAESPEPTQKPSSFLAEDGQWIVLIRRDADRPSRSISEIRLATFSEFVISVAEVPRWMAPGSEVDAEVDHDDGREFFVTTVLSSEQTPAGFHVTLSQPSRSWRHNRRNAKRASVEIPVRYSLLDGELHPGIDHDGVVNDLSVTGMRLDADERVPKGQAIVASLKLRDGWLNVVGDLVSEIADPADPNPQMRIAFRRLRDSERSRLIDEVSSWTDAMPDEIVSPQILRSGPPRHVVEAYAHAGGDRRS